MTYIYVELVKKFIICNTRFFIFGKDTKSISSMSWKRELLTASLHARPSQCEKHDDKNSQQIFDCSFAFIPLCIHTLTNAPTYAIYETIHFSKLWWLDNGQETCTGAHRLRYSFTVLAQYCLHQWNHLLRRNSNKMCEHLCTIRGFIWWHNIHFVLAFQFEPW